MDTFASRTRWNGVTVYTEISKSHSLDWIFHGSSLGILFSAKRLRAERLWISYSVVNAGYYVVNDCTNQSTHPSNGQHPHIGPSSWRCTVSSADETFAWNLWQVKSECTVNFLTKPQNSHWHNYGRLLDNVVFRISFGIASFCIFRARNLNQNYRKWEAGIAHSV